ncbi:MAG: hypothetical protein QS748_04415 [Candidatus Endonucleobacter bathymodioli]|uniref:Tryptophan synthase beta chain-like PALP domain-containing protein n=1 Tax=Candidatus Endonucleibacter bathymodioli TaxID=539814 RepID=A0AA90NSF2_9GAMM|nr:hypothetical protein [Candidatus Endonucleobacter bathymodioli]
MTNLTEKDGDSIIKLDDFSVDKALIDRLDLCIGSHSVKPLWIKGRNIKLDILRLDKLHPTISGNKWFKLRPYLQASQLANINTVMSFGGIWSNHIHALAAAGQVLNINTIGVIRGEEKCSTAMLQDAQAWGMKIYYVSRRDYRKRNDQEYKDALVRLLGYKIDQVTIVPEGGGGELGVKGSEGILSAGNIDPCEYDEIWLGCGTGSTLAGVVRSIRNAEAAVVRGVAILKEADFLRDDITHLLQKAQARWTLDTDSHCGGYGRTSLELLSFIEEFEQDTGVPLDQVYTGKVMLALKNRISREDLVSGCRILMIHTGGLQGKRGLVVNGGRG